MGGLSSPLNRERPEETNVPSASHDPTSRSKAFDLSLTTFHEMSCTPEECRIPIGVLYREEGRPTYEDGLPQLDAPLWRRAQAPRDISADIAAMG